jgi:exodeoxyribonuclease VII small subunit
MLSLAARLLMNTRLARLLLAIERVFRIDNTCKMAKKTFESALARLEQLTEELDNGDITLENSLKKFEEGIKLANFCSQQLAEAKAKVELLLKKDGQIDTVAFDEQSSGDQELSE